MVWRNIIMIVINIEDFENNVRYYLDKATKKTPHDYIFVKYGNREFIILSEEMMSRALVSAVNAGERRAKENTDNKNEL